MAPILTQAEELSWKKRCNQVESHENENIVKEMKNDEDVFCHAILRLPQIFQSRRTYMATRNRLFGCAPPPRQEVTHEK